MENLILKVEKTFDASVSNVWKALTDKTEMKKWYFDLAEFKAEKGFVFSFVGGPEDGEQYTHICEITEVIREKKLAYSWRYEGYKGISFVTFELQAHQDTTTLLLTHTVIESFPEDPNFALGSFKEGWNYIINTSLKEYLEGSV